MGKYAYAIPCRADQDTHLVASIDTVELGENPQVWLETLVKTTIRTVHTEHASIGELSGSTLSAALVDNKQLSISVLGDSPIFCFIKIAGQWTALSTDKPKMFEDGMCVSHNKFNQSERVRVGQQNLSRDGSLQCHLPDGRAGKLALYRCIGDRAWDSSNLSHEPQTFQLNWEDIPDLEDFCVIVSSDGTLIDRDSNAETTSLLIEYLNTLSDTSEAAKDIADLCRKKIVASVTRLGISLKKMDDLTITCIFGHDIPSGEAIFLGVADGHGEKGHEVANAACAGLAEVFTKKILERHQASGIAVSPETICAESDSPPTPPVVEILTILGKHKALAEPLADDTRAAKKVHPPHP